MALPIWWEYMGKIYKNARLNVSNKAFPFPENGVSVTLNCDREKEFNNDDEF